MTGYRPRYHRRQCPGCGRTISYGIHSDTPVPHDCRRVRPRKASQKQGLALRRLVDEGGAIRTQDFRWIAPHRTERVLRTEGWIEYPSTYLVRITDDGRKVLAAYLATGADSTDAAPPAPWSPP